MPLKPGDIVVYRERADHFENDVVRRATIMGHDDRQLACVRSDVSSWDVMRTVSFQVRRSDVIRVEESQHGWTGR